MHHDPAMRRQAVRLFAAGRSRAEVARALGIARSTSSAWYRRWAAGRPLETARVGRRPRLDRRQLTRLGRALLVPPGAHGLPGGSWSLRTLALLIERETGERYHHRHVARLVPRMGWTAPPFARHARAARYLQPIATPIGTMNLIVQRGTPAPPQSSEIASP